MRFVSKPKADRMNNKYFAKIMNSIIRLLVMGYTHFDEEEKN